MDNTASLGKVIKGGDLTDVQEGIIEMMQQVGALQEGHFQLSSGLHSKQYMQCQKVLQYPRYGKVLAAKLAEKVVKAGFVPQAVVGPALGAVHLELLLALALDEILDEVAVRGIFAERVAGSDTFEIRRGIEIKPGEQILVVEDVITTGQSAAKVLSLVKELGGVPIAVAAIVDRGSSTSAFSVPLFSLIEVKLEAYEQKDCPMCRGNMPVSKPGSRVKN